LGVYRGTEKREHCHFSRVWPTDGCRDACSRRSPRVHASNFSPACGTPVRNCQAPSVGRSVDLYLLGNHVEWVLLLHSTPTFPKASTHGSDYDGVRSQRPAHARAAAFHVLTDVQGKCKQPSRSGVVAKNWKLGTKAVQKHWPV